ncbi:MAG: exodeoxyribonuclease V subunit gamma [Gammaproteobacteria bacterium]|nr:exodeoxyribonuclease V subunit gamma [Gammaproteobacteria bacterium]
MDDWIALLRQLIADFYADTPESAADLAELHAAIAALGARLDEAGYRDTLTREVLLDMLQEGWPTPGLAPVPAQRHQLLPADARCAASRSASCACSA